MVYTFILGFVHGYSVDLKRPFYFNIPDKTTGIMKYYRTTFNAAFSAITATENAPKITEKDFKELLIILMTSICGKKNFYQIAIFLKASD